MIYRKLYIFHMIFQWVIIIVGVIISNVLRSNYGYTKWQTMPVFLGVVLAWGLLGFYWYEKWHNSATKED